MKKLWRSITGNDGITRENKNRMNTSPFSNVIFIGNGIILMSLTRERHKRQWILGKGKRLMIDELYDSLYKELTGWCTSMTGNRSLAEDLVQEAFLRALINAALLEELDAGKRRAWMYRTVKNLYIDRKRREAFETMVEQMPEKGFEEAEYAWVDNTELLKVLTPEERLLFTLRYLEGYNSAELGKLFGLPPGTIRSRLSSARSRLRKALSLKESTHRGKITGYGKGKR